MGFYPATYSVGIRFLPSDLASENIRSGSNLTKVKIFTGNGSSDCSFTLNIYQGGTFPTNQGTLVYTQPLTTLEDVSINEITLTNPVTIDVSKELWVTYQIVQDANVSPAGCDDGPRVDNKGNIIFVGGEWTTLYDFTGYHEYNWHIQALIERHFISVDTITNLPTTATENVPLALTGTVIPSNADYKDITWSLVYPGNTNASIIDGVLYTSASGKAVLRATVANGGGMDHDYTQDFSVTVGSVGIDEFTNYGFIQTQPPTVYTHFF